MTIILLSYPITFIVLVILKRFKQLEMMGPEDIMMAWVISPITLFCIFVACLMMIFVVFFDICCGFKKESNESLSDG